jgi:hypothetical protein
VFRFAVCGGIVNWEVVGAIGEIIAAVAVIASLIYLGRQFRLASTQAVQDTYQQTVNGFSASKENAELVYKGSFELDSLSPEERFHYMMLLSSLYNTASMCWEQHQKGVISDATLRRILLACYHYYTSQGGQAFWKGELSGVPIRNVFPEGFVDHIESESEKIVSQNAT